MMNEQSWVLTGAKVRGIWVGVRRWESEGQPASVTFPFEKMMRRERFEHDVIGFLHTHPNMAAVPSQTDVITMEALVLSLGKTLLCLIDGADGLRGYMFTPDGTNYIELAKVYLLDFDVLVGIEHGRSMRRNKLAPSDEVVLGQV